MHKEIKKYDSFIKKEWETPIIGKLSVLHTLGSTTASGTENHAWSQNGNSLVPSV